MAAFHQHLLSSFTRLARKDLEKVVRIFVKAPARHTNSQSQRDCASKPKGCGIAGQERRNRVGIGGLRADILARPPDWPPSRRSGAMARREGGKSATRQVQNPRYLRPWEMPVMCAEDENTPGPLHLQLSRSRVHR